MLSIFGVFLICILMGVILRSYKEMVADLLYGLWMYFNGMGELDEMRLLDLFHEVNNEFKKGSSYVERKRSQPCS